MRLSSRRRGARSGIAAVEFAIVAPVMLFLVTSAIDCGYLFQLRLRLVNAVTLASIYAFNNGPSQTAATVPSFISAVSAMVTKAADVPGTPTATVLFNNASDGGSAGNYYCLSGFPAVWSSTGTASGACGSSMTSGRYVTITGSVPFKPLFPIDLFLVFVPTLTETALVRVQ